MWSSCSQEPPRISTSSAKPRLIGINTSDRHIPVLFTFTMIELMRNGRIVLLLLLLSFSLSFAWFGEYQFRSEITEIPTVFNLPLSINGTGGWQGHHIWINTYPTSTYHIYYNSSTIYTIVVNDTAEIPYDLQNETGHRILGNAASNVWQNRTGASGSFMQVIHSSRYDNDASATDKTGSYVCQANPFAGWTTETYNVFPFPQLFGNTTGSQAYFLEVIDSSFCKRTLNFGNATEWSISLWVYPQSYNETIHEIWGQNDGAVQFDSKIFTNESGHIGFMERWGGILYWANSSTIAPLNQWSMITVVKASTGASVYLNTTLIASNVDAISKAPEENGDNSWAPGTYSIHEATIGARTSIGVGNDGFDGYVDEIRIINSSFSTTEIAQMYNNYDRTGAGAMLLDAPILSPSYYGLAYLTAPANESNITANQTITYHFDSNITDHGFCTYAVNDETDIHAMNYNPITYTDANTSTNLSLDENSGIFVNGWYNISIICEDADYHIIQRSLKYHYLVNNASYPSAIEILSPANGSTIGTNETILYRMTSGVIASASCTYVYDNEAKTHAYNYNPIVFTTNAVDTNITLDNTIGQITNGTHTIRIVCSNYSNGSYTTIGESLTNTYIIVNETAVYPLDIILDLPLNNSIIAPDETLYFTLSSWMTDDVWCSYRLDDQNFTYSLNNNPVMFSFMNEQNTLQIYYPSEALHNISVFCVDEHYSVLGESMRNNYSVVYPAIEPTDHSDMTRTAYFIVGLLFMCLMGYGGMVAAGMTGGSVGLALALILASVVPVDAAGNTLFPIWMPLIIIVSAGAYVLYRFRNV